MSQISKFLAVPSYTKQQITDFFPFSSYRPHQKETIEKIQEYLEKGVNDIIVEMPTGSGKSPVAIASGLWSHNSYCLTSQKILQDQYIRDFTEDGRISVLKGRSNYECTFLGNPAMCNECYEPAKKECYKNGTCIYQNAKVRTICSEVAMMNYAYFLNVLECDPAKSFKKRNLLILDECLPGHALIWIDDNKQVKMSQLYENENITHVISFNENTNSYEKKKILNKFKNKVTKKDCWYLIVCENEEQITKLKLTSNHKVWTKNRGYVIASELTCDDIIKFDTSDKKIIYYCDKCEYLSASYRALGTHRSWHKNSKNRKNNMKKSFIKRKNSINYKKYCEDISKRKKLSNSAVCCVVCKKEFKKKEFFNLHYFMCHNNGGKKQWSSKTKAQRKKILKNLNLSHLKKDNHEKYNEIVKNISERMKSNNPSFNPDVVKKMSNSLKENFKNKSEEEQDKIRQRWINLPKHNKLSKPTKFEQKLIDLNIKDLAFTGDGKFWLTLGKKDNGKKWSKNPDFKIIGQRKVIEVGDICYWHTVEEIKKTVEAYNSINFECLYLTNNDFEDENWDKTVLIIKKFIFNHDVKILKIKKIIRKSGNDSEKYRYNIEVQDNHNYFANNILVSNCHSSELEILRFVEFVLSEFMFKRVGYPVNIPLYDSLEDYHKWIQNNIGNIGQILVKKTNELNLLNSERARIEKESHDFKKISIEITEISSQVDEIDRVYRKMNKFLNTLNDVEWVFTVESTEKLKMRKVIFRPLTVDKFSHDILLNYGKQRLYLSATILDKKSFCKSLGINHEAAEFIRTPSTFPVENRKIYFTNSGYMNLAKLPDTLPSIVTDLTKALDYHKTEKGLIHCASYKISNYIKENCHDKRLIFHDSETREKMLHKFLKSKTGVLVSPSMTEGLDLKDDLARWEVIVKIPYLFIGDKQIAKRMQVDPDWYIWQTCLTLVQSYGRIFRSETDWGSAYIFDSGAKYFIQKNKHMLPDWFLEACQF